MTLPDWRMAIVQVTLATVDVAVTAAIFYALLPPAPGLTYLRFLASMSPPTRRGSPPTCRAASACSTRRCCSAWNPICRRRPCVGAILVFRLYYYIIPLFLAGGLFAGNEILLRGRVAFRRRWRRAAREHIASGGGCRSQRCGSASPISPSPPRTGAVALCGALLLSLGVLEPRPDFSWIDPDFAALASSAGQYVPSLIGTALHGAGDRAVAPRHPGLGCDHPAAARGRGLSPRRRRSRSGCPRCWSSRPCSSRRSAAPITAMRGC